MNLVERADAALAERGRGPARDAWFASRGWYVTDLQCPEAKPFAEAWGAWVLLLPGERVGDMRDALRAAGRLREAP